MSAATDDVAGERTIPGSAEGYWIAAAAVVLAVFYAVLAARFPLHGICHDDGIYVQLGLSLTEGRYALDQLPGAPSHGKYPPLFPTILAVVAAAGADPRTEPWVYCIPGAVMAAAGFALWYFLLRRSFPRLYAAFGATLAALAPGTLHVTSCALSEPVILLLLPATLIILDRPASRGRDVAGGLLALAMMMTRMALVPVVAALALARWRTEGTGSAARFSAPGVMGLGVWGHWVAGLPAPESDAFRYYNGYGAMFTTDILEVLPARILDVGFGSAAQLGAAAWLPASRAALGETAGTALDWFAAGLGVAAVALLLVRARRTPATLRWSLAAGVATCLPTWWSSWRFLLPFLPLIAAGLADLGSMLRIPRAAGRGFAIAGLGSVLAVAAVQLQWNPETETSFWTGTFSTATFGAASRWLSEDTLPDAVVATDFDPFFHLVSGRRTMMIAPPVPRIQNRPDLWNAWTRAEVPKIVAEYRRVGVTHLLIHPWMDPWVVPMVDWMIETGMANEVWRSGPEGFRAFRLSLPER